MANETYKINQALPSSAPIESLRYKTTGSRWYSYFKKFPKVARQACEDAGIETVADLEGWSKDDLTALSGIGRKSAQRLLQAADNAEVNYRGTGFPWELVVTIPVPVDRVEGLRDQDQEEVEEALASLLSTDDLFDDIQQTLRDARVRELEARREQIEAELQEIT